MIIKLDNKQCEITPYLSFRDLEVIASKDDEDIKDYKHIVAEIIAFHTGETFTEEDLYNADQAVIDEYTVDFSKHESGRSGTISVYKSDYNECALMWVSEDQKSKEVCYDVTFKENADGVRTEYSRFPKIKIEAGVKYPVFLSVNSDEDEDDSMQEGRMTFDGIVSQNRNVNAVYLILN